MRGGPGNALSWVLRARVPQRFMSSNRGHDRRAAAIDSCPKLFTASHSRVS